jgi:hypothetical protein
MSSKKPKPKGEIPEVELVPDAWPRFERFIKAVAKAGPKHRPSGAAKTRKSGTKKSP